MSKYTKIVYLLIFIGLQAYAQEDQTVVDVGFGVFNSAKLSLSEVRMASIGVQEDLWGALKQKGTIGGWTDNAGGGRLGSAFAAGQLGFEVNNNGWVADIFSGPCLISAPDAYLGSNFQFMEDIHLGLQDNNTNYIGILYRHISDAGLSTPNIGRDFIGMEIKF